MITKSDDRGSIAVLGRAADYCGNVRYAQTGKRERCYVCGDRGCHFSSTQINESLDAGREEFMPQTDELWTDPEPHPLAGNETQDEPVANAAPDREGALADMLQIEQDVKTGNIADLDDYLNRINAVRETMGKSPVYGVQVPGGDPEGYAHTSNIGFIDSADRPTVIEGILESYPTPRERRKVLMDILRKEYGDLEKAAWDVESEHERPKTEKLMAEYAERQKWRVGIVTRPTLQLNDRTGVGLELVFSVLTGDSGAFTWSLHGVDIITALEDAGVLGFKHLEGKPCYYEPEGDEPQAGYISRFKKFWKVY